MLSCLLDSFKDVEVGKMRAPDFLKRQNEIECAKLEAIAAGSGWREVAECPLCGSQNRRTELSKHGVDLVACTDCSLRYGRKIPSNLEDVYHRPGYVSYSLESSDEHFRYRRDRFGRERVGILEHHIGDLSDRHLLDVGCGNGYFLAAAMEKCRNCYGTEASATLREFARRRTGLTIYEEQLEFLAAGSFDVITLFDVIEHIPGPVEFMRVVDRLLRPGGAVLIFTPNCDSLSVRVMKELSSIVDPTEHVVLFTLPALQQLGKVLHYTILYRETQGMDVDNILALHHYKGEAADGFLAQWRKELQAVVNAAECGDYARIIYQKGAGLSA
jgi:2-polyprenyl-3-methyl-5-hydroxy-6-metoxy-1,4-benzoquinol methylase